MPAHPAPRPARRHQPIRPCILRNQPAHLHQHPARPSAPGAGSPEKPPDTGQQPVPPVRSRSPADLASPAPGPTLGPPSAHPSTTTREGGAPRLPNAAKRPTDLPLGKQTPLHLPRRRAPAPSIRLPRLFSLPRGRPTPPLSPAASSRGRVPVTFTAHPTPPNAAKTSRPLQHLFLLHPPSFISYPGVNHHRPRSRPPTLRSCSPIPAARRLTCARLLILDALPRAAPRGPEHLGPRADMNHPISPPPPPHPLLARSPAHPAHYRQPRSPPHLGRPVSRASAHLGRTRPSTSRGGPAPKHQHQHQHHWKPNLATYLTPPQAPTAPCSRGEPPRTPPSPPARLLPPLAHPALSFRFITPARCHPANSPTSQQVGKPTNRQAGKPKSWHTPPTTSTTGDHLTRLNPPPTYTPSCALTLPPGKRKTLRLPPPLCYPPTSHRQQGSPPPVTRPNVPPLLHLFTIPDVLAA